jgi:virginiamycin B lyase
MRRPIQLVLLGLALAICAAVPAEAALTPTATSFPSSKPLSSESHPYAIAAGSDGQLWFTDPYQHKIARMSVDGTITLQKPIPPTWFPYGIAAGSDGAMWFVTEEGSPLASIGRIDATGGVLSKELTASTYPRDITAGPQGALWFTESSGAIGRMPALTPLAVPDESRTIKGSPNAIAAGPDGNLWFIEYIDSKVGRMTPSGTANYFSLPKGFENPEGIAAGPDGALWYTVLNPPAVVRISTTGVQQVFPLPEKQYPGDIALGPDNALWFAARDRIGRMTTAGAFESFPVPSGEGLVKLTPGPDGNVWFTEANAGRIGRITTPPNVTTGAAVEVQSGQATIAGTVNGHSQPTDVTVEYGPVGSATTTSAPLHLSGGGTDQAAAIPLSRLVPATLYRYRVVATNPTGTAAGTFGDFTTGPPPKCRIKKSRLARKGVLTVKLTCSSTSSISAAARIVSPKKKSAKQSRSSLFGRGSAKVVRGKATLRIKPKKAARKALARHARLSIRLAMKLRGGGAITGYNKSVHVRRPARSSR